MSLGFGIYYWDYIETQTWPGAFTINLPALVSIGTIIAAGVLQVAACTGTIRPDPATCAQPYAVQPMMTRFTLLSDRGS